MQKIFIVLLLFVCTQIKAQPFQIRGVLPWHNFLSGPSAWNEDDYAKYLDDCQKNGINFIAFHNYTGGGERYLNYVEPMIKIQYKNVLPEAGFDHSGMARWGYLPMKIKDFPFGLEKHFFSTRGVGYFGADCAVTAKTNEERYEKAQSLMQKVLAMAHERKMQMAMGFEFGVAPPEYASIRTNSDMYWKGDGSLVYNPFDPDATGILYATIDNIIETYKGIDWIYLWLNEHCMFGINPEIALKNKYMQQFYSENEKFYDSDEVNESLKFLGVWSQAYIQKAYNYIRLKAPGIKIAIGGWGSESQMALLLRGLDKALPQDITFSMLNPDQGKFGHPAFFSEIAQNRDVWAIPWLESDASLWHLQPRVDDLRSQVKKASADKLNGVIGIHWRTEEIRENFETFMFFAQNPDSTNSTNDIYRDYCAVNFGNFAAQHLSPVLAKYDINGILKQIASEEYYAYTPAWGKLSQVQINACNEIIQAIDLCNDNNPNEEQLQNLKWLKANYQFALLFNNVSRGLEPAWNIRDRYLIAMEPSVISADEITNAKVSLKNIPIRQMMEVFASKVRSRGELGELSSIIQRVWGEYQLLDKFLKTQSLNSDITK